MFSFLYLWVSAINVEPRDEVERADESSSFILLRRKGKRERKLVGIMASYFKKFQCPPCCQKLKPLFSVA